LDAKRNGQLAVCFLLLAMGFAPRLSLNKI